MQHYNGDFRRFEDLEASFRACTGMEARDFLLFDCDNYHKLECPLEAEVVDRVNCPSNLHAVSRQVLYENVMLGLFDKNFAALELKKHYGELCEKFSKVAIPPQFKSLFENYAQVLKVMEKKCDIGNRLTDAYAKRDLCALGALQRELLELVDEMQKMYELRSILWHEHNKPFGFEEVGNRMFATVGMVRHAAKRVEAFLNGDAKSLPELEAERLPYDPKNFPLTIEWNMNILAMP